MDDNTACDAVPPASPTGVYVIACEPDATDLHRSATESGRSSEELLYKLSKRRWAVLAGITIFGFLNGFAGELSAVLGTMVDLLELPLDEYVYVGQAAGCVAPLFALPTAWLVDRHGLRAAALVAALLAAVRNATRALLFWPQSPHWRELKLLYWLAFSVTGAQVNSIYWCLPLKISEGWFSERERAFAWSCMAAGPLLGNALSSLWTPWAVEAAGSTRPLVYANLAALVVSVLAVGLCVTRSAPREPPSARQLAKPASLNRRPLAESIKCLLANKDVLIFAIALASFESAENSIRGLMQDILAASGFKQTFCGQYLAVVAMVSATLQLLSAALAPDTPHKTGNSGRCKLLVGGQLLAFALYALSLTLKHLHRQHWWIIIASSLLYTVCRFWASPVCASQMAHLIAGSMSEATVGAAGTIASYLLTNVYTAMFVYFRQAPAKVEPHKHKGSNYNNSILILLALVSSSSFLYLFCFGGRSGESMAKSANGCSVSVASAAGQPPGRPAADKRACNSRRRPAAS